MFLSFDFPLLHFYFLMVVFCGMFLFLTLRHLLFHCLLPRLLLGYGALALHALLFIQLILHLLCIPVHRSNTRVTSVPLYGMRRAFAPALPVGMGLRCGMLNG